MLGDYVLHYPITDFAVSLLAVAALIELGRIVLRRPSWAPAVDLLLYLGFGGAIAAVGTGLWLTSVEDHGHSRSLTIHHYFAYSTLGFATVAVIARALEARKGAFAKLKTGALLVSAALVSGAGFYGGSMAHGAREDGAHAHPDDPPPAKPVVPEAPPASGSGMDHAGHPAPMPAPDARPAPPTDHDSRPHTH